MLGTSLFAGPLAIAGQGKDQALADPSAAAGDPEVENAQERIVSAEPAATVKEVLERRARLFSVTLLGFNDDNSDREELRLLPKPLIDTSWTHRARQTTAD